MRFAFIFPGQGSQSVGMGRSIAQAFSVAREAFEEVDDSLHQKLSSLMWEGPESELTLTENAQPAIMAVSLGVLRVLEREAGLDISRHARLLAGHSLGEYSALAAAGCLRLGDAAKLLKLRGRAMQEAVPAGEGAMSALIGIEVEDAEAAAVEAAAQGGICVVANDNAPGQVVISGTKETVERAGVFAKEKGARRVMSLAVSAPFHCPLMAPAAEKMREALAQVALRPPAAPILANVTATEVAEPEAIRSLLVEQVTARVRWRESVLSFRSLGADATVECGGGKVLTGMVKRIDRDLETISIDTPADIEAFARRL